MTRGTPNCHQEIHHGFEAMEEILTFLLIHSARVKIINSGVRLGSNPNPTPSHVCRWANSQPLCALVPSSVNGDRNGSNLTELR